MTRLTAAVVSVAARGVLAVLDLVWPLDHPERWNR